MPDIKKSDFYLSFLQPVSVEKTSGLNNEVLEVVLSGGKLILNSENTNYSFGSLHALFRKVLRRLDLNWNNIDTALILGFGAGCVAETIWKYNSDCLIDGVEIDEKVIELGAKYFHQNRHENLNIHCCDAARFTEICNKKYSLIIIDVYQDMIVPDEIETEQFLLNVRNCLKEGAVVIFNKFVNSKASREKIRQIEKMYKDVFGNVKIITSMMTGKIFVSQRISKNDILNN